MSLKQALGVLALAAALGSTATAQLDPYTYWTLLPSSQMDEIIGEASGESAWNVILETGGYNRDRQAEEYAGDLRETKVVLDRLHRYGVDTAEVVRYPGGEVWDGVLGELWEVSPKRRKLASYHDMTAALVRGSQTCDVTAELVWVGRGTKEEIEKTPLEGKIVVTDGSLGRVSRAAFGEKGALGLVAISTSREHFDPIQIPWSGIRGRQGDDEPARFAFYLTAREGEFLRRRLLGGETITAHARVETRNEPYELQDITCTIPGTDPEAGEVIFSAHLFEGIVKQGANDNLSGSASILEVARILHTLIAEGRLPRPRRTICFLWGPEFSGTGPWVKDHKELMRKTLCNINMDMVGEWLSKNKSFMCLERTTYGNAHYINDVVENYYRFVGETSREHIHTRHSAAATHPPILAPTGADEPFPYRIEVHYGSSDHEVFNDWGVQVPGIMMIAWPDQWYHTSGDRVDKSDPTQLKRVAVIGAAAAYTIAAADDAMAVRIAGETAGNATRRLGRQFTRGLVKLDQADAKGLAEAYRLARVYIGCALDAENATLDSVLELATDRRRVKKHIGALEKSLSGVAKNLLASLEDQMRERARALGCKVAKPVLSDLEKAAAKMVPKPTERILEAGYRGWRNIINEVPKEQKEALPYGKIASTNELSLLIDGKRTALQIRDMLDAQYERSSDLQSVTNYLKILELSGLVKL